MRQAEDVAEQGGMRWFIVAFVIAGLLGTLVRLMVAPHKIEMLVRAKIATSPWHKKFEFKSVEVDLADGPFPDFALVLSGVSWRPTGSCQADGEHRELAPIRAASVRVPLKWSSLVSASLGSGRLSAGRLVFEELTVDVDEIKRRCPDEAVVATQSTLPTSTAQALPSDATESVEASLFDDQELSEIANSIGGIKFLSAEVYFENRMKSVLLEDTVISIREREIDLAATVRFPPATVFGESTPAFSITGTVRPSGIIADIRADLNEGTLEANAVMKPIQTKHGQKELDSQIKLTVSDLPLSMMTPLLTKSGVVQVGFRPRFAWLDCNAEIKGIFSRLFVENPVRLAQCEVSGQAGRVRVDTAVRESTGRWQPFELVVADLDIGKVIETFQLEGATGIFAEYGKLTGKVRVNSATEIEADAAVKGSVLRFAGGDGMALQTLDVKSISMASQGTQLKFKMKDFEPLGGQADLTFLATHDWKSEETNFEFKLDKLKLNSRVEKVIFTGPVAEMNGKATGQLRKKVLSKLNGSLTLSKIKGSEFSSEDIRIDAQVVGASGQPPQPVVELTAKAPLIEVHKSGYLFSILRPALLGWAGVESEDGKRLAVGKVAIKGRFGETGFTWTAAQASIGGVLNLSSEGQILRDQVVDARLAASYPGARRLFWDVRGTWRKPEFAIASDELRTLLKRPEVQIPTKPGDQGLAIEAAVVPLRYLGVAK